MSLARSQMPPRTSTMGRNVRLQPGGKLKREGKKGREWRNTIRRNKPKFIEADNTRCERCNADDFLGHAHGRKRRKLKAGELEIYALLCNACHDIFERMTPLGMLRWINKIVRLREERKYHAA